MHVTQVDAHHDVIVVGTSLGPAQIRATLGRELDAVCFLHVSDVLGGREAAGDFAMVRRCGKLFLRNCAARAVLPTGACVGAGQGSMTRFSMRPSLRVKQ
ncbi:hypothetical protein ADL29_18775 [Streptomyces chattanoogensis]|uniref:Uncharacterized protein n=1 Tax=Streptomyces chattanoogensis TaxID=66876 RepID=A0A0N0XWM0_9ACTN|nr:hypothetical protein ADL29_18775 [Streptomyces chattanoogensis]